MREQLGQPVNELVRKGWTVNTGVANRHKGVDMERDRGERRRKEKV